MKICKVTGSFISKEHWDPDSFPLLCFPVNSEVGSFLHHSLTMTDGVGHHGSALKYALWSFFVVMMLWAESVLRATAWKLLPADPMKPSPLAPSSVRSPAEAGGRPGKQVYLVLGVV